VGEGKARGILFVGEGPGRFEEEVGRPFIGPAGMLLRDALKKLGFSEYYFTNLVACRACEPSLDPATNEPRFRQRRGHPPEMLFRDVVPTPTQIEACRPRLMEEIYMIDPVVIVALGGTASEALLNRPVSVTREPLGAHHMVIPGATTRPVLTEKKQVWGRKIGGVHRFPVETNEVRYIVIPTLHPAYVLRKIGDQGPHSAVRKFGDALRLAVKIYERYLSEVFGIDPTSTSDADLSEIGGENDPEIEESFGGGDP
jgi:uracil-DNA glycosylase